MTATQFFGVNNMGSSLDRLDVTTDSIKGYATLIHAFLESHVSLAPGVTLGIYSLLEEQCRDLEDVADDLRKEYQNQRREEMEEDTTTPIREKIIAGLGADTIHDVAARLGLDEDTIYNVVLSLAFPNAPLKAPRSAERRIEAAAIAETLNLKASTVQKVIDVLMASSKPYRPEVALRRDAGEQQVGKAVNE